MARIQLIFGTYNGQPKGLSNEELEAVYQRAYKPFLTALYGHPSIKGSLYYSGTLLDWFEETHPEFMMLLNDMVKRRQIELLGGGYYDPILSIIPTSDRLGQIEHLTTLIRKRFGRRVRGAWLAEGIWEPFFPSVLKNSGMEYTFVEGDLLKESGYSADETSWAMISEDQGKAVAILPISSDFKKSFLAGDAADLVERMAAFGRKKDRALICLMLDGRALGEWGDSYDRAYGQNWLEEFLQRIAEQKKVFEPVNAGRLVRSLDYLRPVYLGCSSISSDGKYEVGINGKSFFRQNLSCYPESRRIYSKMIHCHSLVNAIRGDKSRKRSGRIELYKGQGASAYWNDRGNGIYRNSVRKAVYRSLLEAEKITRERGIFRPGIFPSDFRLSGDVQYLYQGQEINGYLQRKGATLFELDYLPRSFNYLDTMSRWKEPFHLAVDGPFDSRPREAFQDHFLSASTTLQAFQANEHVEDGDFIEVPWDVDEVDKDHFEVSFKRTGSVRSGGKSVQLTVEKKFAFKRNGVDVEYRITNESAFAYSGLFGPEINLSFLGNDQNELRYSMDDAKDNLWPDNDEILALKSLQIQDLINTVNLTIEAENPSVIWNFPIVTVSRYDETEFRNYQGQCLLPLWLLSLGPEESWSRVISLSVGKK